MEAGGAILKRIDRKCPSEKIKFGKKPKGSEGVPSEDN
jgi:hypothetical protein